MWENNGEAEKLRKALRETVEAYGVKTGHIQFKKLNFGWWEVSMEITPKWGVGRTKRLCSED